MTNEEKLDFCNYLQPILNGCTGFIKTSGYFYHKPGQIVTASADGTFCSIMDIPVRYDVEVSGKIGDFLNCKEDVDKVNFDKRIYFIGWNIHMNDCLRYLATYGRCIDALAPVYTEDDATRLPGFETAVKSTDITTLRVTDGTRLFRFPASKIITPMVKGDTASLKIYPTPDKDMFTVRWTIFKKKFKINVDIFYNILVM